MNDICGIQKTEILSNHSYVVKVIYVFIENQTHDITSFS